MFYILNNILKRILGKDFLYIVYNYCCLVWLLVYFKFFSELSWGYWINIIVLVECIKKFFYFVVECRDIIV